MMLENVKSGKRLVVCSSDPLEPGVPWLSYERYMREYTRSEAEAKEDRREMLDVSYFTTLADPADTSRYICGVS